MKLINLFIIEFIFSITCSPDGNYLLSGGEDKSIKLWSIKNNY